MIRILTAAALALSLSHPLPAIADESAVQGVISSQIEAFKSDDFGAAFAFASPAIKRIFGSPERFGAMVRNGYPMVWRPAEVRFLDTRPLGEALIQRVLITDARGTLYTLEYQMIETDAGWQINGVAVLQAPQLGA